MNNGCDFYENFFQNLIIPFKQKFNDAQIRSRITEKIEKFFDTSQIDFIAIDGTCQKDAFTDFIVFFGGAYGAKGRVSLEGEPPKVRYERWEMNRDISMVAWVPVPFAELSDVTGNRIEESFMVSDADRINLSNIHTSLMQLAEIYLAYNVACSSATDYPKLIMLDQSLSGIMAASSHGVDTALVGYPYDRRQLDKADVVIALAHPFNAELDLPSTKRFRRYTSILAEFHKRKSKAISLAQLQESLGLSEEELKEAIEFLSKQQASWCTYDHADKVIKVSIDCEESWEYTKSFFERICSRLFIQKDQSALIYEVTEPEDTETKRRRWMSPDDIHFLIAVGLRALIEKCWEKNIMLVGVVKDSESRYLTRNYLGVMMHKDIYPELQKLEVKPLPWTDRIYLETIPTCCDDDLEAPWGSIEFDAIFMTLHLGQDTDGTRVMGTITRAGEIVAPERIFLRSLAQFFFSRKKKTPLMGHVVFLDRLACPKWDKRHIRDVVCTDKLGRISPIVYKDRETENIGQEIMVYLLNTLTRNHFPEVIGYPDPLHKADLGAKSVGRRAKGVIESSEIPFRMHPIAKTLRSIRDSFRR